MEPSKESSQENTLKTEQPIEDETDSVERRISELVAEEHRKVSSSQVLVPQLKEDKKSNNVKSLDTKELPTAEDEQKEKPSVALLKQFQPKQDDTAANCYKGFPYECDTEAEYEEYLSRFPGVHFGRWWVRPIVMQKSRQMIALVEGEKLILKNSTASKGKIRDSGYKLFDLTPWHSSTLATAVHARVVQSASGNKYYLHGELDCSKMQEFGYSQDAIAAFKNGFPLENDAWKEYSVKVEIVETTDQQTEDKPTQSLTNKRLPKKKSIRNDNDGVNENEATENGAQRKVAGKAPKRISLPSKVKPGLAQNNKYTKNKFPSHEEEIEDSFLVQKHQSKRRKSNIKFEWGTGRVIIEESDDDGDDGRVRRSRRQSVR